MRVFLRYLHVFGSFQEERGRLDFRLRLPGPELLSPLGLRLRFRWPEAAPRLWARSPSCAVCVFGWEGRSRGQFRLVPRPPHTLRWIPVGEEGKGRERGGSRADLPPGAGEPVWAQALCDSSPSLQKLFP